LLNNFIQRVILAGQFTATVLLQCAIEGMNLVYYQKQPLNGASNWAMNIINQVHAL